MKILSLLLITFCLSFTEPDCKDKLKSFPEVIRTGHFVNDLGCRYDTIKIKEKKYTYEKGKKILAKQLFKDKNDALFVAFVNQVFYHNNKMISRTNDRFEASKFKFESPTVTKVGANYVVKGWVSIDGNMDPRQFYKFQSIIFSPDGNVTKGEVTDSFAYSFSTKEVEY